MLMSKSRLEKFLYALYSLDSSDLPVPRSRIEELYSCLVTGDEVPTSEPLSRVEKYLLAILGVYDVNELPNPLSRVEVLLYKLAIGDDNLDDVKSFLSEHEELLAEIIRNGGVGGNIDIEYVLYTLSTEFNTLYNTAEKPVKSAILKGNTIKKIGLESGSYNGYLEKIPMNDRLRTIEPVNGYDIIRIDCKNDYQAYIRGIGEDSNWGQSLSFTFNPKDSFVIVFKKNDGSVFSQSDYGNIIEYTNIAEILDNNGSELVSVKMPVLRTSNEDGTKTNILTVNEEVELRGIGDVKDELDSMTGELTQRIGEYQITGEEKWTFIPSQRRLQLSKSAFATNIKCGVFACDILQAKQGNDASLHSTVGTYYIGYSKDTWLRIILGEDLTSLEQGEEWLKANKPTIQYQLMTESVKTVDLSVVNQDGNNTKLSTFNDITHVTLSSDGLIPEAEMTVATKNEEVLNAMSLEMDDISTTQTTLEETSNTQSENVDATMMATTEIYEQLL